MARHGRGGELVLWLGALVVAVAVLELERAATPKVAGHAADRMLEHLADLACLEMTEIVPG